MVQDKSSSEIVWGSSYVQKKLVCVCVLGGGGGGHDVVDHHRALGRTLWRLTEFTMAACAMHHSDIGIEP